MRYDADVRRTCRKGRIVQNALRIGHGYDVHRLVAGRRCIIGGVEIPYEKGLLMKMVHERCQVMRETRGKANPGLVNKLLKEKLG